MLETQRNSDSTRPSSTSSLLPSPRTQRRTRSDGREGSWSPSKRVVHGSRWPPFGVGSPSFGRVRQRKGEREEGGTTLYDERGRRRLYIVYTKMSADEDDYDLRIDVAKRVLHRLGSHPPRPTHRAGLRSLQTRPRVDRIHPLAFCPPLYPLSSTYSRLPLAFSLNSWLQYASTRLFPTHPLSLRARGHAALQARHRLEPAASRVRRPALVLLVVLFVRTQSKSAVLLRLREL